MPRPSQPDFYRSRARAEGYVARAIYKLKEVDEKYHLFKADQRVLDLGCSPGSWLQYIASRTAPGLVLGGWNPGNQCATPILLRRSQSPT
jgi:23S rRNA (uridine2552-2'-O)-methyltransferase